MQFEVLREKSADTYKNLLRKDIGFLRDLCYNAIAQ